MGLRKLNEQLAVGGARSASSRMSSHNIWHNCPVAELITGTKNGLFVFEDFQSGKFLQATNVAATATTLSNGWVAFTGNDAGNTIVAETDEPYGVVTLNLTGDNLSTAIAYGGGQAGGGGNFVFEAGKRLWMEARVKVSTLTDDRGGFFIGFGEEALCVTVGILGADDALTSKDLVGFHRLAGDGDKLDVVYRTAGATAVDVETDAVTLVADTYVNVGIYCDGETVTYFADGTRIDSHLLTATDFPDGEEMAFYIAGTNKGSTANSLTVDWVKIAQDRTE